MPLVIDIGNTLIKAAVFEQNTLRERFSFAAENYLEHLEQIHRLYPDCTPWVVASVGTLRPEQLEAFADKVSIEVMTRRSKFPFTNAYRTPETLGIDRMILASGAVLQYPGQARLVIDAGTCITYDFVDAQDVYQGGAITPGLQMRYTALHDYTAALPQLEKAAPENFIGTTTQSSIHAGVVFGVVHEIDGFIAQYRAQHQNIIIILTGGDAEFLAKRLKNTIFAHSNFLLESLNQTFQYQTQND